MRVVARGVILSVASVAVFSLPLLGSGPQSAMAEEPTSSFSAVFRVNDVRLIPDVTPGDGVCATEVTYGSGCTLLAAAQETNARHTADPARQDLITLASPTAQGSIRQLNGTYANTGTLLLANSAANTPTNFAGMIQGAANMDNIVGGAVDVDRSGSVLWFDGNVVIDLQNRLSIKSQGDNIFVGNAISFTGSDQVFRNFSDLISSEGSISVGKTAKNLLIQNGRISNGAPGSGQEAANERAISVLGGSRNTRVSGVTIDSMYRAGINLLSQVGNLSEPVHGLTVEDSVFSWENRNTENIYYGIGKWDSGVIGLDDLVITGTTFADFRSGQSYDSNVPISGDRISFGGKTEIAYNRFVNTLPSSLISSGQNNSIRITQPLAPGGELSIHHNTFTNESSWVPGGAAVEINTGSQPTTGITVSDNEFIGWNRGATGQIIAVTSSASAGAGAATGVERNTFSNSGGWTSGGTNAQELPGNAANPIYLNNAANIRTVFPSGAQIEPGGSNVLAVTVQKPQTGGTQPTYPMSVDAFAGTSSGAETYLGRAVINAPTDWAPEGIVLTYPYSGGAQNLRLQTVDASGAVSPLSRTISISGADESGPQLWVEQAGTQNDPTFNRTITFQVRSSEPLADGALTPSAFELTGSSVGAEVLSVTPSNPSADKNTRWAVAVRANAAGTIGLGLGANAVTDRAGLSNPSPATSVDAAVIYQLPISLNAPGGELSVSEPGVEMAAYTLTMNSLDTLGRNAKAPIGALTIESSWSDLELDPTVPPVAADPAQQALILPTYQQLNPDLPTMDPVDSSLPVNVQAIDNRIFDGTRQVDLSTRISSTDPEYDGLLLPPTTVKITDDDAPLPASSPLTIVTNGSIADASAQNRVKSIVQNAAGQTVSNVPVAFSLPEGVSLSGDAGSVAGPATVTRITNAAGEVELAVTSTVAGVDFSVGASVGEGQAVANSPAALRFVAGSASAPDSELTIASTPKVVDTSPHIATVTVRDIYDNPVNGESVLFESAAIPGGSATAISGVDGTATIELRSTLATSYAVNASIDGSPVAGSPSTALFSAGSYSLQRSEIATSRVRAQANGTDALVFQIKLKDAFGNDVTQEHPSIELSSALGVPGETIDEGNGLYSISITSETAGAARIGFTIDGRDAQSSISATFVATPATPQVQPTNGLRVAGSADPGMTIVVRDADNTVIGSGTSNSFGLFDVALLSPVVHNQALTVLAQNSDGFYSAPASANVDSEAPAPSTVLPSNGRKLTICPSEASSRLVVKTGGGALVSGALLSGNDGCFIFTPDLRFSDQDEIDVFEIDPAGNVSNPTRAVIDITPPATPQMKPSDGKIVEGGTIADGDSIVFLNSSGQRLNGMIAIDEHGRFSFSPSPALRTTDSVSIMVTDPLENSVTVPIVIDEEKPKAPVVAGFAGRNVAGTAEPHSNVTVRNSSGVILGSDSAGADGSFSVEIIPTPRRGDAVAVDVTDSAGNQSERVIIRFDEPSVLLAVEAIAPEGIQIAYGYGFEPGETVSASISGRAQPGHTSIADASGNLAIEVPLAAGIVPGSYTIELSSPSNTVVSTPFEVRTETLGEFALPQTGGELAQLWWIALLVLAAGGYFILGGRIRRATP